MTRILAVLTAVLTIATASAQVISGSLGACSGLDDFASMYAGAAAREFKVPPPLLAAVVLAESSGNPWALNPEAGSKMPQPTDEQWALGWNGPLLRAAYGLAQIRGITMWDLQAHYTPAQLFEPSLNLRLAAKLLRQDFDRYNAWDVAVAAYNRGDAGAAAYETGHPINARYVDKVMAAWTRIGHCETP